MIQETNRRSIETVVYAARCSWWGILAEAGDVKIGNNEKMPACPHCKSVLFEMPKKDWDAGMAEYEKENPGYTAFCNWLRSCGRCFPNSEKAKEEYDKWREAQNV
jgi:hypothetical protein